MNTPLNVAVLSQGLKVKNPLKTYWISSCRNELAYKEQIHVNHLAEKVENLPPEYFLHVLRGKSAFGSSDRETLEVLLL